MKLRTKLRPVSKLSLGACSGDAKLIVILNDRWRQGKKQKCGQMKTFFTNQQQTIANGVQKTAIVDNERRYMDKDGKKIMILREIVERA